MSMFHQLKKLYWLQQNSGFKPRLPDEYEELEYVYTEKSDTTYYVDTGLKASALDEYTCKAALTNENANEAFIGDGNTKTDSNVAIWLDRRTTPSYKAEFSFGDGGNASYKVVFNDSSFDVSEMHEYKMSIPTKSAYVDGTLVGTASSASAFANSKKLVLFGSWRGTKINSAFTGKMGECSIVRDGVEIRRFVPAMRKSDGVCGFYDLCGNNSPVWPYDTPFYTGHYADRIHPGRPVDPIKCNIEYLAPEKLTLYAEDYVREHKFSNGKGTLVLDIIPDKTFSWFYGIRTVTSIKLTGYEKTIGIKTLGGCSGLVEVLNMDNIETVNQEGFTYCASLQMTSLPPKLDLDSCGSSAFYSCASITVTELPAGTTTIPKNMFRGCAKLALTSLPSTLTTIGQNAFYYCSSMPCSTLPVGLTTIEDYAFYECRNVTFSTLPSGITELLQGVFYNCVKVAFSSLPEGLTKIGYCSFYGCSSITSMTLPSTLQVIGQESFRASGLTSITIPASVSTVGAAAFQACTSLTTVTFEGTPTSIGADAFFGCTALTDVYCAWTEGTVADAPWGAPSTTTIHYVAPQLLGGYEVTGSSNASANGTFMPTGNTEGGHPEYSNGTVKLFYYGSWMIASSIAAVDMMGPLEYQTTASNDPDGGVWSNNISVTAV